MIHRDYAKAQQLAMLIPHRFHPNYRSAVHRWAQAIRQALHQDNSMTLPDLATRHIPTVPTPRPVYAEQWPREAEWEDRLRQIEQRLTNLEILVRVQEFSWDDGK